MATRTFLCSLLWLVSATTARAADQPNFVFMIADDLGWADVAFHGGNAPTPHLDRLAREGLELTRHYVAPVCSPTRAGLLTGRWWSRFGITTPINTRGLPWNTTTIAKALKSRGYATCLTGKWHLGSKPEWGPNQFGFDHAYGSLAGGVSPWNHRYKKGDYSVTWHRNGKLIEEEGHVTDLLTSEAVNWIQGHRDSPFFLYVPFTAIHLPLKEPAEWVEKVPDSITGEVARHYAASIMHLDDSVGRILQALEETGVRKNTLVVFTSDNGGSTAENNDLKYPDDNCPNGKLTGNNYPLRGQKGSIYEGGTRVPTLVSWPGRIPAGKNETPVAIVDWMPTFCALAGKPGTTTEVETLNQDGVDLTGLLLQQKNLPERSLYITGPRWRATSLHRGKWKLVVTGQKPNQQLELFDLTRDPSEKMNLVKQEPRQLKTMLTFHEAAARADRDALPDD